MKNLNTYKEFVNESVNEATFSGVRGTILDRHLQVEWSNMADSIVSDLYKLANNSSKLKKSTFQVIMDAIKKIKDVGHWPESIAKRLDSVDNFDPLKESLNEAMVQVAGNKKPAGAKVLATIIIDKLDKEGYLRHMNRNESDIAQKSIEQLIIDSTF